MNINKNNYEEFFMMYADNELSATERKAVEAFVAANPGMQEELDLFHQFKLAPDNALVYTGKDALLKTAAEETAAISLTNYESFFVLYADDELTTTQKAAVENFVYHHPQVQSAFELFQQVKLSPDNNVVFKNKESLYRKEEERPVIALRWWQLAAAAMILLLAGIFWLTRTGKNDKAGSFVKTTPAVTNPPAPSLYDQKEVEKAIDTNNNQQPEKENIARKETNTVNPQATSNPPVINGTAVVRKKLQPEKKDAQVTNPSALKDEETVASVEDNRLKAATISSDKNETGKQASINTAIAAAVSKSVTDQQLNYSDTHETDKVAITQAVATSADELEVLNTSVNTKNSLRGFFRKASRLIAKKTGNDEDDSKHKSILIGGFEIAVR